MRDVPSDARAAKLLLERTKDLLAHLYATKLAMKDLGFDYSDVERRISELNVQLHLLEQRANGRIEPRNRPGRARRESRDEAPEYYLFLDECGSHVSGRSDVNFPAFGLAGVIVEKQEYEHFDDTWKTWKAEHLGSRDIVVHEPDLRHGAHHFRRPHQTQMEELLASLEASLAELDFVCIAAVVDHREFIREHPDERVDDFLPRSTYLMCIDFIMERFVHFLHHEGGDGRGLVLAESRGAKEDAQVHAEFIRLHIVGTQFISDSWFRHQLRPYIEFQPKSKNNSGLQVADLAARPLVEKVLSPESTPLRWEVFKQKLYDGGKNSPHSYGLKVYPLTPSNDPFPEYPKKARGNA